MYRNTQVSPLLYFCTYHMQIYQLFFLTPLIDSAIIPFKKRHVISYNMHILYKNYFYKSIAVCHEQLADFPKALIKSGRYFIMSGNKGGCL